MVALSANTVKLLLEWNDKYGFLYDGKFIKRLALDVFGRDCLSKSSVFGNRSHNSGVQHERLDETKVKFVKGIFLQFRLFEFLYIDCFLE